MSRVADMTSLDNPLMRRAAATGAAQANRRGLINSSMGIGAAQDAVLGVAVPIASQEAAQEATAANLATQIGSNEGIAARDISSREKLTSQQISSNEGLAARDITSRESLASRDIMSREGMAARDLTSRETLSREQVAAGDRERMVSAQVQAGNSYSQSLANTLNNPDIPAATRTQVQAALLQQYNDAVASARRIYGF